MRACGLWLLCLVVAGPLVAQPAPFDVRGRALDEALRLAGQRARFDLTYDPALVAGRSSRCVTTETAPGPLLACVLEGSGLVAMRVASDTYALRLAPRPLPPPSATLRGRVLDAETGLPLSDASVILMGTARGALAGPEGVFVLEGLPHGIVLVRASHVGYAQAQAAVRLAADSSSSVTLSLPRAPAVITPVVVEGLRFRDPLVAARMSEAPEGTSAAPEEVAARLVAMTGIHPGRVVADLHLQGGEAGEHLMTLDGAPIYAPPVVAGLVGPFSPFAIGRITLQKAGYGALPVSSTVGVIEAEHTFPVEEGRRLDVQADALALHARLASGGERPDGLRVQLMVAGRFGRDAAQTLPELRKLLRDWNRPDPFLAAVTASPSDVPPSGDPAVGFLAPIRATVPQLRFDDVHLAVQALHPSGRRLTASAYVGTRQLVADVENLGRLAVRTLRDQYTWYSTVGQVRYDVVQSARLRTSVQARASLYRLAHRFVLPDTLLARRQPRPEDDGNTFGEAALHGQFTYQATPEVWIEAGVLPTVTNSRFSVVGARREVIRHRSARFQLPSYAGVRARALPRLEAEVGLRVTLTNGRPYAEPRAALRYDLPQTPLGALAIRVGAGIYRQFVQPFEVSSISPSSLVSATRVWLVVDRTRPTPIAYHYSAEAALLPAPGWTINLESYYRRQARTLQVDFSAPATTGQNVPQEAFLIVGQGYAYGAAAQLARAHGRSELRARYELSYVERQSVLFRSAFYPVPWNEPHRVEISVALQPLTRLALSLRWMSSWGRTWAFRRAYYDYVGANDAFETQTPPRLQPFVERQVQAYGLRSPRDQRLPAMHRLDVGVAYAQPLGPLRLQARLDVINALAARNVDEIRLVGDERFYEATKNSSGFGLLRSEPRYALPLTAILSLRVSW
jgi:hypothetical protein